MLLSPFRLRDRVMNKLQLMGCSCVCLLMTACISNPVPLSGKAPVANSKEVATPIAENEKSIGDANIVLIRRYAQPTAFPISIRINDEKVASLGQRQYSAISLPKGKYEVVAKWPLIASQEKIEFEIDVDGDVKQYFEFTGEYTVSSAAITSYVGAREFGPEEGLDYVSTCCKYVDPKK